MIQTHRLEVDQLLDIPSEADDQQHMLQESGNIHGDVFLVYPESRHILHTLQQSGYCQGWPCSPLAANFGINAFTFTITESSREG